ncbi:hypothetical protein GBF38_004816, partial [Nibea albiflora]
CYSPTCVQSVLQSSVKKKVCAVRINRGSWKNVEKMFLPTSLVDLLDTGEHGQEEQEKEEGEDEFDCDEFSENDE